MADLYSTLGVQKGASEAEIKKAYRTLAKELHPDRNQGDAKTAERFGKVTAAYDLLSDKEKRAQYDRGEIDEQGNPRMPFGYNGGYPGGGFRPGAGGGGFQFEEGDIGDIFSNLFGRGQQRGGGPFGGAQQRRPQKGPDVAYRLKVPFEDAAALKPQRITLANGKTIDLKLPTGVEDGRQMRLGGQGEAGPGGNGDALVTIEISPHHFFTRDGDHVRIDLPISLDEAVLGAKVRAPTVEGAVMLSVPAGSTSGKVLRLKGKGFHNAKGQRGDQLVTLIVDLPADDADLKAFVEGWKGRQAGNPRAGLGV